MIRELLRFRPGHDDLSRIDPRSTPGLPKGKAIRRDPKLWARGEVEALGARLATQQEMLYATAKVAPRGAKPLAAASNGGDPRRDPASRRRLLLVLQAMDSGGKDGTVKRVAGALNPQGLQIVAFGPPTAEERAHPFLWRIRRALPPAGYVGVFNRSHYEDVLVVRVHNLVPPRTWRGRYDQINRFEAKLVDDGYTLVKVMLHISYAEQRNRLLARLDDPTKHWKFNPRDVLERQRWPDYQEAYADALGRCSTDVAPWYVVPADRKWYRDWAVASLLLEAVEDLDLSYPPATFDVEAQRRALLADSDEPAAGRGDG